MAAKSTPLVCRGHTRPIPSLAFSPIEKDDTSSPPHYLLVSSCKDGVPMLRMGYSGDWLGSFIGHKGCAWSIKLSATTTRAITGSADFTSKVWDATDGSVLLTLPHEHIVRCVDLNAEGTKAVTGGHEKKLRVWDVQKLLQAIQTNQSNASNGTSNDATAPSEADMLKHVKLLKPETGGDNAHDGTIKSVIWDSDNSQIVSAGEDKCVKFWNVSTLECEKVIRLDGIITSMERCHDATGTIALTYGNSVEFIDPKTREPYLTHVLNYSPSAASIHPILPEKFVAGSTQDGWVRVHEAKTGTEVEVYKGHHGPVHAISYSPDGELYASGSEDGTIRLWQTTPKTYGLWRFDGQA